MFDGNETSAGSREAIADEVLVALRRIIRAIELHSHDLEHRYGLTGPQLAVLKAVGEVQTVSVGMLARRVHLSQATVTGIVNRLLARSFVTRERCESDHRRVLISLAPQGQAVLRQTPPSLQESFTAALARLEDWEQTQILSSLQRVVSMMEARDIEPTAYLATESLGSSNAGTDIGVGTADTLADGTPA